MPASLQVLLNNTDPVRADDAEYTELFKDLQCNILTPHNHRRAYFWFVQFGEGEAARRSARELLAQLARTHLVRIAERQRIAGKLQADAPAQLSLDVLHSIRDVTVVSEYDNYWCRQQGASAGMALTPADQAGDDTQPIHVNVLLASAAYDKLGVAQPNSEAFQQGMAARGSDNNLHDPPPENWGPEYHDEGRAIRFDALLIVGCNPERQQAQVDALRGIVKAHVTHFLEEEGNVIRVVPEDGEAYSIEPFGYRDGISQPVFYEQELSRDARKSSWDPFAPLALTLLPDPNGRTTYACGTYFVFRKLQQNIALFHSQSDTLAGQHGDDPKALRARFVGRWPDGTPLTPGARSDDNDFDFDDDQRGLHCPFHAHVRKSNPRRDVRDSYNPKKHRIVRRAIPYGPAIPRDERTGVPTVPSEAPSSIGLLFLCAQADIEAQFEHIQGAWGDNPDHPPAKLAGIDTVSGQSPGRIMLRTVGSARNVLPNADYEQVVDLMGGEYFFAPSISFLRSLLDDS